MTIKSIARAISFTENNMPCAKRFRFSTKVTDTKSYEVHLDHSNEPDDNKRNEVTIMGWAKYEEDNREAMEEGLISRSGRNLRVPLHF